MEINAVGAKLCALRRLGNFRLKRAGSERATPYPVAAALAVAADRAVVPCV